MVSLFRLPWFLMRLAFLDALFSMISPIILVTKWLMVSRTLAGPPIVAYAIIRYLGSDDGLSGNDLSAEVWKDLWPIQRRRQREFFFFGMDILLKLDLPGTRKFFDAFLI